MKSPLIPTTAGLILLSGPALADLEYTLGSGATVTFYGQLNPAIISVDDGRDTETNLLDNDLSSSRVGLRYAAAFGDSIFRFRLETGLGLPNSTEVSQAGSDYSRFTRDDIRHFDFSLEGNWGRVSLGQGSMAADGVAEVDLSYVGTALYSYTADSNASFLFRDGFDVLSGPAIADTTDNFDGSRRGRIRYDSPDISGFTFSASAGENILDQEDEGEYYDVGVFYNATIGGGAELSAGLAYQRRDLNTADRSDIVASASVLLQNGLGFTVATGDRDDDAGSDPRYYYAKVSYEADWLAMGKTGFGLHYWDGSDFNVDGSDSDVWGIGVVQEVSRLNTDLYLTYQEYDYSDGTGDFQDNSTIVLGALWTF
ncbi:porin [Tateyamaria omphalii]|uniref:porin n=1 Tax=Tateyamaria omphalii TaxID=299262 RepID=UPI001C996663|nr:porin [Tateyamaria omphalii]MBY5935043.1 porin [Tateyamaria omphalii]